MKGGTKTAGNAPLRILARLDAGERSSRGMVGGILRYAALHHDVEVRLYGPGTPYRRLEQFRDWRPDGIVVGEPLGRTLAVAADLGVRAAVLSNVDPPADLPLRCAGVFCDNAAIAAAAADFFAGCRVKALGYVGDVLPGRAPEPVWSAERGAALRERAARLGLPFSSFAPPARRHGAEAERRALGAWLAALPRPCGVLAANDMRASVVLEACRAAGVAVPRSVLVLGVDDEEFVCRQTRPTLSSFVMDWDGGGFLEAETLVELLRGRRRRLPRRTFGILGIARRQSTGDTNEARLMVARAEEFIAEHATTAGIGVGDVAKAAFASLRLLQANFKAVTGRTVLGAIQEARLAKACEPLSETNAPIGEIAGLCGFRGTSHLKELFRRRFGRTMRAWRGK